MQDKDICQRYKNLKKKKELRRCYTAAERYWWSGQKIGFLASTERTTSWCHLVIIWQKNTMGTNKEKMETSEETDLGIQVMSNLRWSSQCTKGAKKPLQHWAWSGEYLEDWMRTCLNIIWNIFETTPGVCPSMVTLLQEGYAAFGGYAEKNDENGQGT